MAQELCHWKKCVKVQSGIPLDLFIGLDPFYFHNVRNIIPYESL